MGWWQVDREERPDVDKAIFFFTPSLWIIFLRECGLVNHEDQGRVSTGHKVLCAKIGVMRMKPLHHYPKNASFVILYT